VLYYTILVLETMAAVIRSLNRLLPFATPGTPLVQDLLHLAALCTLLYFAPQIQARLQDARRGEPAEDVHQHVPPDEDEEAQQAPPNVNEESLGEAAVGADDVNDEQAPLEVFDGQPGPARPLTPSQGQRVVGTKKAASLARKDQRRHANEMRRWQAEEQRAKDAEEAEEREKAAAPERERRKAAAAAIEEKRAKERSEQKQREDEERQTNLRRQELAVSVIKKDLQERKCSNLLDVVVRVGGDVDEVWLEKILNARSVLGTQQDGLTMVTGTGWVVRVTAADMHAVYEAARRGSEEAESGEVSYDDIGRWLQHKLGA